MQYGVEINGRTRHVVVRRTRDGFDVTIDGARVSVDAIRVAGHTLSLLVGSRAYEVTVAPDAAPGQLAVRVGAVPLTAGLQRRRPFGARRDEAHAGGGPDRIVAPMPGKIVRVLVKSGEAVRARQPVVVVEAMKMENELRARADGTVTEVHASAGASVEAGALLVVIQ